MSKLVSEVIGKLYLSRSSFYPLILTKLYLCLENVFVIITYYNGDSLIVLILIRCFFYPPNALNKPLFQCQAKPLSCCIRSGQHSILSHDKKVEPDEASSFVTLMHERMYTKRFLWFFLLIVLCCIHFYFMACLLLYPCNHSVLFLYEVVVVVR